MIRCTRFDDNSWYGDSFGGNLIQAKISSHVSYQGEMATLPGQFRTSHFTPGRISPVALVSLIL